MIGNGKVHRPLMSNGAVSYAQSDEKNAKRIQQLLRRLNQYKKEVRALRQETAQNRADLKRLKRKLAEKVSASTHTDEQIAQLEDQLKREKRLVRTQALILSREITTNQTGILRNQATGRPITMIIMESTHFPSPQQQDQVRVIWAFRLAADVEQVNWDQCEQFDLCLKNGPAVSVRLAATPTAGSNTGLLEFI